MYLCVFFKNWLQVAFGVTFTGEWQANCARNCLRIWNSKNCARANPLCKWCSQRWGSHLIRSSIARIHLPQYIFSTWWGITSMEVDEASQCNFVRWLEGHLRLSRSDFTPWVLFIGIGKLWYSSFHFCAYLPREQKSTNSARAPSRVGSVDWILCKPLSLQKCQRKFIHSSFRAKFFANKPSQCTRWRNMTNVRVPLVASKLFAKRKKRRKPWAAHEWFELSIVGSVLVRPLSKTRATVHHLTLLFSFSQILVMLPHENNCLLRQVRNYDLQTVEVT